MKKLILSALVLSALALPAQAANRCYSAEELRAERLLRLHSELMVITVTCKQATSGRDLGRAYTGFTSKNIRDLRAAEETMTGFYKASYGGKGVDRLDTLRTKLANEYGQQIADISAPTFCAQRRDKVVLMHDSPPSSLWDEAMTSYEGAKTYNPVCSGVVQASAGEEKPIKKAAPKAKKPGKEKTG